MSGRVIESMAGKIGRGLPAASRMKRIRVPSVQIAKLVNASR